MFTIFEYLRKRAFDSIVAGVQDAVDSLDKKSIAPSLNNSDVDVRPVEAAPRESITSAQNPRPDSANIDPQKYLAGPGPLHSPGQSTLPQPRKRGRPPKEGNTV